MWLWGCLIWLCDVSRWPGNTTHGALVNGSPGSNYKWAVYICMTPGIWTTLNQSHIVYSDCWLSDLLLPLVLLSHPPFTISPLSRSPCHVSCLPLLCVFLCSPSTPPLPPHYLLSSLYLATSFLSMTSTDSAFTLRGALHLTAGAEADLMHPQWEREKLALESHNC